MYSSNDRYYAAQMAAERREMQLERCMRTSRNFSGTQARTAVLPAPQASFALLNLLASLILSSLFVVVALIIIALVLIPLGL